MLTHPSGLLSRVWLAHPPPRNLGRAPNGPSGRACLRILRLIVRVELISIALPEIWALRREGEPAELSTKRPPSTNKATNGRGRIKIDLGPGDKNRHTLINNRNKSIKNSIRLWRFRSRLPVSGEEGNEFVFIRFIRMKIKRSTVCYPHPFVFLLNRLIIRYLRPYPAFMSLMSDCRSASGKGPQKEGRADEYTGTVNKLTLADRPPSLQLSVDVLLALADGSK